MSNYTLASFFAGVGGIDAGFEKTGQVTTVYANEIDPYPAQTFEHNFPISVDNRDIRSVTAGDFPDVDIIAGGFPCQAFSIAGHRQGFDDEKGRGTLFFEMMRLIREKKPRVVFLENVKNLTTHDEGRTLAVILEMLEGAGYACRYKVLNAMVHGDTPQNRERIYIVAFRESVGCERFEFPEAVPLTKSLRDVIDFSSRVDAKYYYTLGRYKDSICVPVLEGVTDPNAVYQWRRRYVRKNKSGVVPTLTANMGSGGHNVPLVRAEGGVRKLTPRECFLVQGFPSGFILPEGQSDSRLYKQAGNSVCVGVVHRIAEKIVRALEPSTVVLS